nr:hypothetical protein [Tanacetum cinerariifolium]
MSLLLQDLMIDWFLSRLVAYWKEQSSHGSSKDAEESYLLYLSGHPAEHQLLYALGITPKDSAHLFVAPPAGDLKRFDILRKVFALGITPKDSAHLFVAPPAGDLALKVGESVRAIRNKADLDTMSMCDVYNNLKVYEPEVKGMSSLNSNTQNMAFLSFTNSNTNGAVNTAQAVNTANGVSTASTQVNAAFSTNIDNLSDAVIYVFLASQPNSPQLAHEDLEKIHPDDIEEMDLRCDTLLESAKLKEIKTTSTRKAQEGAEEGPNYALMAYTSSTFDSKIVDNYKKGLGYESYNAVLPPYIGNFMPLKPELSFTSLDEFANKTVADNIKSSKEETKVVRKNNDVLIIKECMSDDEEENVTQPKIVKKTVRPNIVKKEFVKPRQ